MRSGRHARLGGGAGLRLLLAGALALAAGCGKEREASPGPSYAREVPAATAPRDVAVMRVAGFGEIRIELLSDLAPQTVANFEKLADAGFYDGTTFHRVIPGFMIQGGDPNSRDRDPRNDGSGGPGYTIPDEIPPLSHVRGRVSMANLGYKDTGGSQFFILVGDAPHLDGKHALFGNVVAGLDVADRIAATPRDEVGRHGPLDRPLENAVIESVRIERASPPGGAVAPPGAGG